MVSKLGTAEEQSRAETTEQVNSVHDELLQQARMYTDLELKLEETGQVLVRERLTLQDISKKRETGLRKIESSRHLGTKRCNVQDNP